MKYETGLLHKTDQLRKLIMENPELPLLILAGENACSMAYSSMFCYEVRAYIGEFLDCDQDINDEIAYSDRDNFEDDLRIHYEDTDECENMSDEEFDKFIEKKLEEYDPYWKKCIILYADN